MASKDMRKSYEILNNFKQLSIFWIDLKLEGFPSYSLKSTPNS
jgi:hypothetical protein